MTPIAVGIISRTFFYVPFWIGRRVGFFLDAGLDVSEVHFDSADRATAALRAGTIRFSIGPAEGVIEDAEGGGSLRIIAGNTSRLIHDLIVRPVFERIEDLKGATIGCVSLNEGSTFHFQRMASAHGLKYPRDYRLEPVGGAPTRWKHLQAGTIDAGLQSIPLTYIAEEAGFRNLGSITRYIPEYQFATTNAARDWADEHRSTVEAFLSALKAATEWMYAHREDAVAIAAEEMRVEPRYAARAWTDFTRPEVMPRDLSITSAGLTANVEILVQTGRLAPDPARRLDRYLYRTALLVEGMHTM